MMILFLTAFLHVGVKGAQDKLSAYNVVAFTQTIKGKFPIDVDCQCPIPLHEVQDALKWCKNFKDGNVVPKVVGKDIDRYVRIKQLHEDPKTKSVMYEFLNHYVVHDIFNFKLPMNWDRVLAGHTEYVKHVPEERRFEKDGVQNYTSSGDLAKLRKYGIPIDTTPGFYKGTLKSCSEASLAQWKEETWKPFVNEHMDRTLLHDGLLTKFNKYYWDKCKAQGMWGHSIEVFTQMEVYYIYHKIFLPSETSEDIINAYLALPDQSEVRKTKVLPMPGFSKEEEQQKSKILGNVAALNLNAAALADLIQQLQQAQTGKNSRRRLLREEARFY